jgi:3-methyladenine DNA glycosylase AlkD
MRQTDDILKRLRAAGSEANTAGVATHVIRAFAQELGADTELASALWSTKVLEARILATMIADPLRITDEEVERWVREFDGWSVCDSACIVLFSKTPFAWRKVREWSYRKPEFERRAAFVLLVALAVHDKEATDGQFRSALLLIWRAAGDKRYFVKKAVNWALHQIGKRNDALREAAIAVAQSLIATQSRSARWIGRDTLSKLRPENP